MDNISENQNASDNKKIQQGQNNLKTMLELKQRRETTIAIIYSYEVLDQMINIDKAFEEHDIDKNIIDKLTLINKYYDFLQSQIQSLLKVGWSWKRIAPLIRSILLLGALELMFIDKAIVIDQMVQITKEFTPSNDQKSYKFVNAILENIYVKYKNNKIINS